MARASTSVLEEQLSELMERVERLEKQPSNRGRNTRDGSIRSAAVDGRKPERAEEDAELRVCSLVPVAPRSLPPGLSRDRVRLIEAVQKKWVNGTKLRYYFFSDGPFAGPDDQKEIVREGFDIWTNEGIGIHFEEVQDIGEAEIRIGFLKGDGAWSFVGRDVIDIPAQNERTMNFGWDLSQDPRREYVAVHEIGHTLGFPHEHQSPFAGIEWDEDAVYRYFGGPPNNWSRETTHYNVIRKLSPGEVEGTNWDPDSIMEYAFKAGLIKEPAQYRNGLTPAGGLSKTDIEQVRKFYPPLDPSSGVSLRVGHSELLDIEPAEQKNFVIEPPESRVYRFETLGKSDTVMILFEDIDGDLKYVDGVDDSGAEHNSSLEHRLFKGRRYVLRVRLYSAQTTGRVAVAMS